MTVPEVDIDELTVALKGGAPLIDVREPHEYEEAHVPGATLIPLRTVTERVDEVPTGGTVYVICAVGGRSRRAAEFYRAQGIDAVNVAGGTAAWVDAGNPFDTGAES